MREKHMCKKVDSPKSNTHVDKTPDAFVLECSSCEGDFNHWSVDVELEDDIIFAGTESQYVIQRIDFACVHH